jgi:hypothetical protein
MTLQNSLLCKIPYCKLPTTLCGRRQYFQSQVIADINVFNDFAFGLFFRHLAPGFCNNFKIMQLCFYNLVDLFPVRKIGRRRPIPDRIALGHLFARKNGFPHNYSIGKD